MKSSAAPQHGATFLRLAQQARSSIFNLLLICCISDGFSTQAAMDTKEISLLTRNK